MEYTFDPCDITGDQWTALHEALHAAGIDGLIESHDNPAGTDAAPVKHRDAVRAPATGQASQE